MNARQGASHRYRAMRDFVRSTDDTPTPDGPRYATRKDFVYGEDVTIVDWTISTQNLPLYESRTDGQH